MATKNPPRAGRYVWRVCLMPAPFLEGRATLAGAVDLAHRIHTFRYTVAGQRRPLTGFPC